MMDADAVELIDRALARYAGREIVAASEVADLLLDIRLAAVLPGVEPEALPGVEVEVCVS